MGALRFGMADLANLRFALSPLWETVASRAALADPGGHVVHLPWIKRASALEREPGLRRRTAALAAFGPAARAGSPVLAVPAPRCPLAEFQEEADALPADVAAAALAWWEAAVQPYWPRVRALLEADLAYRGRQLTEDGIHEVLARLHPDLTWEGDRLVSWTLADGPCEPKADGLTLTPSAFATRCRLLPGRPGVPTALVYPARGTGTLWEVRTDPGTGLSRLLGRSRAGLLAQTCTPSTTTGLAARTGLTPGAVSQHLSVLRDAGLVVGHRYGREVHYTITALGQSLLERR
ncbi:ArsR family transcriptional regulator [Streptomyces sp. NPDC031705]|uniref:ArsR/SmtB family transcription factor n=1 Tax=Streptomyces sp. NPDC031705 TaxID=3155729 RepID=UPI0033D1051E